MSYIILDCEWNRPESRNMLRKNKRGYVLHHELMQIGAVRLNDKLDIVDTFNSNVRPIVYKIIHRDVQRLTHIKRTDLIIAPYFPDVWAEFEMFLNSDDIIFTWGTADKRVISENIYYWGLKPFQNKVVNLQYIVDTALFEDKQDKSLQYVLDYLELDQCTQGHIAINDAIDTANIFRYMYQRSEGVSI